MSLPYIIFLCIFLLLCLLLVAAVLLQTGKGGGMAGLGGGVTDSAFGAHTTNILQKFTGVCVILFFVLVILLARNLNSGKSGTSVMDGFKAPPAQAPAEKNEPAGGLESTGAQTSAPSQPNEAKTVTIPDVPQMPAVPVPAAPAPKAPELKK